MKRNRKTRVFTLTLILCLLFSSIQAYASPMDETEKEIQEITKKILASKNGNLFDEYSLEDVKTVINRGGDNAEKVLAYFDEIAIPIEVPKENKELAKRHSIEPEHFSVTKDLVTGREETIYEDFITTTRKKITQTEYVSEGIDSDAFSFPLMRGGSWQEFEPQNYADTRSTFKLFIYSGQKIFFGSGFKISGMYIATAGHCINNPNYARAGGWADSVLCVPAWRPAAPYQPLGNAWSSSLECGGNWSNKRDGDDDWGIIKLRNYTNTGYLGRRNMGNSGDMLGIATRTIGYPSDNGAIQITTGVVKNNERRRVLADYPSLGGMSGGPVCNSQKYIIGIHRARRDSKGEFVKFDDWIFNKINSYS